MPPRPAGASTVKRPAMTVPAGSVAGSGPVAGAGAGRSRGLSMEDSVEPDRASGLPPMMSAAQVLTPALPGQLQRAGILGHLPEEALAGGLVRDVTGALAHAPHGRAQRGFAGPGVSLGEARLRQQQ